MHLGQDAPPRTLLPTLSALACLVTHLSCRFFTPAADYGQKPLHNLCGSADAAQGAGQVRRRCGASVAPVRRTTLAFMFTQRMEFYHSEYSLVGDFL